MADIVKHIFTRIDSSANWKTLNPVPRNGEQCIEVLNGGLFKLKVGDGTTPWIALNYWTSDLSHNSAINQTILNITEKYPPAHGYHTLETAIQSLKYEDINLGMIVMFESAENVWETWQFNADKKSLYQNTEEWERLSQGISYIIFNNTEEGEIENGSMITTIAPEEGQSTEDYYELMTLVYAAKDVITGNNKTDRIIIRSSEKSIIGVWDTENQILDINVSPDFIKDIQDKLDAKVDKTFADETGCYVEGDTIYVDSTVTAGLIRAEKTLVNVTDGSTKTKVVEIKSGERTIKLDYTTTQTQDNTNIDVNVDPNNLLIDLGEF